MKKKLTAEKYAKTYYKLPESKIESVNIKSAIRFAEKYHTEQLNLYGVVKSFSNIKKIKMEKVKVNKKSWLENQDTDFIKKVKTVDTIVYPDGSKGELKGTFFIL